MSRVSTPLVLSPFLLLTFGLDVNELVEKILTIDHSLYGNLEALQILSQQRETLSADRDRHVAQLSDILAHSRATDPHQAATLAPPRVLAHATELSRSLPGSLPTFKWTDPLPDDAPPQAGPSSAAR